MPTKKRVSRGRGSPPSGAASLPDVPEASSDVYDVASVPFDDAAATPRQRSGQPPQKTARKESSSSVGGVAGEDPAVAIESPHPTLGEAEAASVAEVTLQSIVEGGAGVSSAVEAIISMYREGARERALCTILNVVAKASGVAEVELDTNALVDGGDIGPVLEELYARVPQDSEAYLLVNKDVRYKRFRRTFPEWCRGILHSGFDAGCLSDEPFLSIPTQWMIAMSASKSRAFRHTSTVALLAFVQALSSVAADLQSQAALLRAKKEVAAVQRRRDDVVGWRDHIFSQAIHQRLRDIAPDIRLAGFQALHHWILNFPEEFLTNKYLRYLGMPLHDKRPELRAEALDTLLQVLARVPDAYSRMHLFLQYFTNRLVELSSDVDVRCTELAIRVVAMMVHSDSDVPEGSELLSNEKVDQVLFTLFDERPTIRAAAGILLKVFIHCRTAAEESETAQATAATELLCSFAATLRSQYRESMPERYLVDALWTPERPPLLLTEYQPILTAAQSDKPLEAVVGLELIAALLLKLQGRLTLGPLPKDDRRGGGTVMAARRISLKAKEEAQVLLHRLSEDAALALSAILEVHRGSDSVLQSVADVCAGLHLSTFTSQRHSSALSALLTELRTATLQSPCVEQELRESLVKGWHQLTSIEHPFRNEAQAHLQELLDKVFKQFSRVALKSTSADNERGYTSAEARETRNVWARMNLVSALVPVPAYWQTIQGAFSKFLSAQPASDATLVVLVVGTTVQCLLWQINTSSSEETDHCATQALLKSHLRDVTTVLLQYVESAEEELHGAAPAISRVGEARIFSLTEILVYLCDLLALPYHDFSQAQQETLIRRCRIVHEQVSAELRVAQDFLKLHLQEHRASQRKPLLQKGEVSSTAPTTAGLAELVAARRACTRAEALQLRLVASVARLFLLNRLDAILALPFLTLWTETPSKAVADTFKMLFYALRDRSGDDGVPLERGILLSAYHSCAEVGATPATVDALSLIGMKLASLHFIGSDRCYPCCPAMVRFGADFATSTDPLLLPAVIPYVGKLRPVDALQILRDQLSSNAVFSNATDAHIRTFVAALRKAAKLEDSSLSSATAGAKQSRALTGSTVLEETGLLDAITQGLDAGPSSTTDAGVSSRRDSAPSTSARGQRLSVAARVVTTDGWHVRAAGSSQENAEEALEVPVSQGHLDTAAVTGRAHRSVVNVPSTQEMAQSSFAEDALGSDEVFVATKEYE